MFLHLDNNNGMLLHVLRLLLRHENYLWKVEI